MCYIIYTYRRNKLEGRWEPVQTEHVYNLHGDAKIKREELLIRTGLEPDETVDFTLLLWDGDILAAAGSRKGYILKCIAIDERYRGQDLTAVLLTELRREAFSQDIRHLFLYTKPENRSMFESLFFYTVAQTEDALLMESEKDGIKNFISGLKAPRRDGVIGSAIMNCNPFTLGHRYLIEKAAGECDWMYVFIVSEEQGLFPAKDRLRLAVEGTADLKNVTVQPTGPYLISMATFPTYFIADKSRKEDIHCRLDVKIFAEYFVPAFNISRRYVGTEPLSPLTGQYNEALQELLPQWGIELRQIVRREKEGVPISASAVRTLLEQNRMEEIRRLVPETTFDYLSKRQFFKE